MVVEFLFRWVRLGVAVQRVECGEAGDKRFKNPGAQRQEMEFALALDLDEAGSLEFLDVVGECRGCDGQSSASLGTAQWTGSPGDALQQFKSLGVCESLEKGGAAGAREADGFGSIFRQCGC
jgi:hypothetical protein